MTSYAAYDRPTASPAGVMLHRPPHIRLLRASLVALASWCVVSLGVGTAAHAADFSAKFDFQPATSVTPVGYTPETGQPYSDVTGRGWVTQSSLSSATHVPLDLSSQTRQRTSIYDARFNTFIHTQTPAPVVRGAFEVAVPTGTYHVRLGVGDPQYIDSVHAARVEGLPLVTGFVPSSSNPVNTFDGDFIVNDGKLTIDTIGGTNTKFAYVEITQKPADSVAPAKPTGLSAVGGTNQVTVSWAANTESDVVGYDLYRSTTTPVVTVGPNNQVTNGATPLNGATRLTGRTYTDASGVSGTQYYYAVVAVDYTGNVSTPSNEVTATPKAPVGFQLKVNFQPAGYVTPVGYSPDIGQAYSAARGYGFVRQSSLASAAHVPLDIQDRMRTRNVPGLDPRLDTVAQVEKKNAYTAAWEAAVPNGDYNVTVAAGDPLYFDSVDKINVEGASALSFVPTSAARMATGTVRVTVADGLLTIDSIGGANAKLQYVTVDAAPVTNGPVPSIPSNVVATADSAGVHVSWSANPEDDLLGYKLYRSIALPVPTGGSATPVTGPDPVGVTAFNDTTVQPTQPYYYSLVAVNSSGQSDGSSPVVVTQPAPQVDLSFNFQPDTAAASVAGYTKDIGQGFTANRGFGWFRLDSLNAPSHVPLDLTPNTRIRNKLADKRLDTFIHMQSEKTGVLTKGAWEATVPNGAYDVTVGVGDPLAPYDSRNVINVEGQPAITDFFPTAALPNTSASITVNVADGRLTLDPSLGRNTKLDYVRIKTADAGTRPSVGVVQPADGATLVSRSRAITAEVNLPNLGAGIDTATLNEDSVRLERVSDGSPVNLVRNTSAGGDVIVAQPRSSLDPNTAYRFEVNSLLRDVSGATFIPKTTTFTTGSSTSSTSSIARFTKTPQSAGAGEMMASLAIGPDDRLYATTLDGKILRFPIQAGGTLGDPTTITTVIDQENGARHILGLAFDPSSTPSNIILWISHSNGAFANAPDWEGKISRLSGPDLSVMDDYVTHLPRSVRDHETNSLAFGPDGALYVAQGSNSAAGATDIQWGDRPERLLSAAILRLDIPAVTAPPLDAKTDEGGTYDPFAAGAPLTIYADGIRNAFDLVWHRNGQLYSAVNGSAAGGNTPATPSDLPPTCQRRLDFGASGPFTGPPVQGLTKLAAQPDLLLRVQQGGYYGHPNPARCEYAFFGGNPTNGEDPQEALEYPVGTLPDRNFRTASWNFGLHFSPNGSLEYKGGAWGGALDGSLLVTRYSAGDDVVALTVDPTTKEVTDQIDGIPGLGGLIDPLDLAEDNRNGNVYVTELGAGRISLLAPDETAGKPKVETTPGRAVFNAVVGTAGSAARSVRIRNSGNAPLRLTGIRLAGTDAAKFQLSHLPPGLPLLIQPDNEAEVDVKFVPTAVGVQTATLQITTDDPNTPVTIVALRGLGTAGEGGNLEPSLQRVLDTKEIPINVGDDDPSTTGVPSGALLGDEVQFQSLRKAGSGPVKIEPVAAFAPAGPGTVAAQFGWTETGDGIDRTPLFQINNPAAQQIDPKVTGNLSFDPGDRAFGFWTAFAAFDYSYSFSEDALNTLNGAPSHQARAWPLKNPDGSVVPNAYLLAFEDLGVQPQDYQDNVVIVRNVRPDGTGDGRVQLTNLDGAPFDDRLVFNRIGSLDAPPPDAVHDRSKVRISNTGSTPFTITEAPAITGPFELVNSPTWPLTVPAGGSVTLEVRFVATSGRVSQGTMTIRTDSIVSPTTRVQLAGYWQPVPENGREPTLAEIVNEMFGYATKITNFGQALFHQGRVEAVGDEVLSPYWRRVDPTKGVRITQLNAWHGAGSSATFRWFQRGGDILRPVLTHAYTDAQSALPRAAGSNAVATTQFYPSAEFGFRIDNEWSDPTFNDTTADVNAGCVGACGHHMRAWPVKSRTGQLVPGTYIVAMDYGGVNYDFQDNVYLLTNITPDTAAQRTLFRVDAGSTSSYTDTQGRVWTPDTSVLDTAGAPIVGFAGDSIANTNDDRLYATTRTAPGTFNQSLRYLDYKFPTGTATKVDLRLNFVERQYTSAGRRQFDILTEGVRQIAGFDVFANVGGRNVATTVALNGIAVTDGALNLRLKASNDYPTISGIEVLCAENCGSD